MPNREQVPTERSPTSGSGSSNDKQPEALSCVNCRTRKLKCDRGKPGCARCAKVKAECVYPESRRKPAFKRRNVRELEARLAQVEGMLKDVAKPKDKPSVTVTASTSSTTSSPSATVGKAGEDNITGQPSDPASGLDLDDLWTGGDFDFDSAFADNLLNGNIPPTNAVPPQQTPWTSISTDDSFGGYDATFSGGELFGLGQFETLPPFEMIEELHNSFFAKQHHLIPIIHKARYLQSFHSAPHMRPPMGLQYAIWSMAANCHEKYKSYHEVFLQRARQYMEADEVKGYGEHFLTVGHAQAWALIATNEARCMLFTRACMSSARCAKLVMMMGLHRLDDDVDPSERQMASMLSPPRDWIELEERRRALWGAFCIDSHASISTGYPNLLDVTEITAHLPSSEEAFTSGKQEESPSLHDVFNIGNYSTFAGAVIVCHLFNQILRHVHRPTPHDRPADTEHGKFWTRHRELDNTLSNAFMFLPERFRLPKNLRNPIAVHTNLNLHASVICLHNAACDKVDKFKLPSHLKKASLDRLSCAAQEIVNIMKLIAHINTGLKSPLAALSIYCATSVYVYQAKDTKESCHSANLEFLMNCMAAIGQEHFITRAFLHQAIQDIKLNGLDAFFNIDKWDDLPCKPPAGAGMATHSIPLLARSSVSRGTKLNPTLPLKQPIQSSSLCGFVNGSDLKSSSTGPPGFGHVLDEEDEGVATGSKRRRTTATTTSGLGFSSTSTTTNLYPLKQPPPGVSPWANFASRMKLAHRSGSSSSPSPASSGSSGPGVGVQYIGQEASLSSTQQQEVDQQTELDEILQGGQIWDMETGDLLQLEGTTNVYPQLFRGGPLFPAMEEGTTDSWTLLTEGDGFGGALNRGGGGV